MKFFVIISLLAITTSSLFAHAECEKTAAKAALRLARPNGNNPDSSVYASVGGSNLVDKSGQRLIYEVQIDFDVNDGGSTDSFPSEVYIVTAKGTESSCKITGVELKR